MAIGDKQGESSDNCTSAERSSRRQRPKRNIHYGKGRIPEANSNIGSKDILFGRGKSIHRRAPNTRLLNFVDIFRDHYSASGPFERNQIVQRIVDMLKNDGYSFRKRQQKHVPRMATMVSESSDEVEDEDVEGTTLDSHSSWVEASPSEVHKRVAHLFRKSAVPYLDASSGTPTQAIRQHQHNHQQQVDAFHQAISSAIDTSSIAATLRKEELQQVAALNQAISLAIDTSSLTQALRDCPSPESTLAMSSSSSFSSFDPALPKTSAPGLLNEKEISHQTSLLTSQAVSPPFIEHQAQELAVAVTNTTSAHGQSIENTVPASTAIHAGNLFQQQFESSSASSKASTGAEKGEINEALPKDGILWSRGTQQIRLVAGMESSLVPVTSFSLLPNAQQEAFGIKKEAEAGKSENGKTKGHLSRTIGYTQQQVGSLMLLRPIVLLPG